MKREITCKKVIQRLNAFIDDEISSSETEMIKSHLFSCTGCNREYESLLMLNKQLAQYEAPLLPHQLKEKLLLIPKTNQRKLSYFRIADRLRPLPIAASILLTIFSALFMGNILLNNTTTEEIPAEYQLTQESLYSQWEGFIYER